MCHSPKLKVVQNGVDLLEARNVATLAVRGAASRRIGLPIARQVSSMKMSTNQLYIVKHQKSYFLHLSCYTLFVKNTYRKYILES